MSFNESTPCNRGLTHIPPIKVRDDCLTCQRPACGPDDGIDPVGAWVDATQSHPGYCRERIAPVVVTQQMAEAFDETGGITHPSTVGHGA